MINVFKRLLVVLNVYRYKNKYKYFISKNKQFFLFLYIKFLLTNRPCKRNSTCNFEVELTFDNIDIIFGAFTVRYIVN